jgi:hypothetical protein
MEIKTEKNWQAHIDAYLSSGLSVNKYCESVGVVAHQFIYRYNRYRKNQTVKPPAPTMSEKTHFASVKMRLPNVAQAPFKILLPNGRACMVFTPFDPKALEQLLEALSS